MGRKTIEAKFNITRKQRKFCEEYVIDFNGSQAAVRSGYSKKTSKELAVRLLTNVNVKSYVEYLSEKASEKARKSKEDVIERLEQIAFANLDNAITDSGGFDFKKIPESVKQVMKIEILSRKHVNTVKITSPDQLGAIKELARHHGIYEKDNDQKTIVVANVSYGEDEED